MKFKNMCNYSMRIEIKMMITLRLPTRRGKKEPSGVVGMSCIMMWEVGIKCIHM